MLERMKEIGREILKQDNRITDQPLWIVQEFKREYGFDADSCDEHEWISEHDYEKADEAEAKRLDELDEDCQPTPGWYRTGYKDRWEFVTACFTEQACKDFIERDGHNHGRLRIYADGSFRNQEYRDIRNFLIQLAEQE